MGDLRVTPLQFMAPARERPRDARARSTRASAPSTKTLRDSGFLRASIPGRSVELRSSIVEASPLAKARIAPRRANDPLKKCIFIPPVDQLMLPRYAPVVRPKAPDHRPAVAPLPLWEDPLIVGTLLTVLPPAGLLLLWSSDRYSRDARIAVTLMSTFFMLLGTAVLLAAILR